jgi:hypothetical protein
VSKNKNKNGKTKHLTSMAMESMFMSMFLFFSASDYWSDNFDEGIKASDTFLLTLYYCVIDLMWCC